MTKIVEKWLLYKYVGGELTPLSKPFKRREQAEKARRSGFRVVRGKKTGTGA